MRFKSKSLNMTRNNPKKAKPYLWFKGDNDYRVNCGCDFVSKIKPTETSADEDGWIIFKDFDFEISSPLKAKSQHV